MSEAFDTELEKLVAKMAHEMARAITALLLRRLGIRDGDGAERGRPRVAAGKPKGRKQASLSARAPGRAAPAASKRVRATASEMAQGVEAVARVVAESDGLSVSEIEKRTKLSRGAATAALKTLKGQGRVFMGGTRRFARYGATQAKADQASNAARG